MCSVEPNSTPYESQSELTFNTNLEDDLDSFLKANDIRQVKPEEETWGRMPEAFRCTGGIQVIDVVVGGADVDTPCYPPVQGVNPLDPDHQSEGEGYEVEDPRVIIVSPDQLRPSPQA